MVLAAPSRTQTRPRRRANRGERRRGDRDARGSVVSGAVGRQSPRLLASGEPERRGTRSMPTRRSGRGVVKRPLPRSCCAETRIRAAALQRKRQERAGSSRGTGTREVVRVARFDRTHRASSPPGVRKGSWRNEGASQERARKHRLTRGTGSAGGETVREGTFSNSGST